MQQKIQQFVFLSERILSEAGELRLRKSWNELHSVSVELSPHMIQLSQNLDPKYALLFLLSCDNESTQKSGCFSMLFRKILVNIPSLEMINLLSAISRVELNNYLLPFLYEKGNIGSVAAYVAAVLGLKVTFDAFEFFLNSRDWSQADLANLSLLALANEKSSLLCSLNEAYNNSHKDVFVRFLNVLNTPSISEAVIPEIEIQEPAIEVTSQTSGSHNSYVNQQTNSNQVPKNQFFKLAAAKKSSQIAASQRASVGLAPSAENIEEEKKRETSKPVPPTSSQGSGNAMGGKTLLQDNSKNAVNKSVKTISGKTGENIAVKPQSSLENFISNIKVLFSSSNDFNGDFSKKPFIVIAVFILVVIMLVFLIRSISAEVNDGNVVVKAPPKEAKIPEYYVDAVTNRRLTPQYIQADVDYRMGELYMARNLYNEAIQFFSDAVKIEPKHHMAKMRWGFAELVQRNYLVSKKLFKEIYSFEPKLQNLNLYMARIYAVDEDVSNAKKHYLNEYKYHNQLDVAMEYANYLAQVGEENTAMDWIANLQEKYPGKMLILNASSKSSKQNSKVKKSKR